MKKIFIGVLFSFGILTSFRILTSYGDDTELKLKIGRDPFEENKETQKAKSRKNQINQIKENKKVLIKGVITGKNSVAILEFDGKEYIGRIGSEFDFEGKWKITKILLDGVEFEITKNGVKQKIFIGF